MSFLKSLVYQAKAKQRKNEELFWAQKGLCTSCGSDKFRTRIFEPGPDAKSEGAKTEIRTICTICLTEDVTRREYK